MPYSPLSILEMERLKRENPIAYQQMMAGNNQSTIGGLQGFTQSPQGQAALLAFANAALQNSQNPKTRGGMGFMNALTSGLGTYNQEGERQKNIEWQNKQRAFEEQQMADYPKKAELEKRKEELQIKKLEAPEETQYAHKIGDYEYFDNPDGSKQKKRLMSRSPDGIEVWQPIGAPTKVKPEKTPKTTWPPATAILMISKGKMKDNEWGITQQEAKDMWTELKTTNPLMQMMSGMTGGNETPQPEQTTEPEQMTDEEINKMAEALDPKDREEFKKLMKSMR